LSEMIDAVKTWLDLMNKRNTDQDVINGNIFELVKMLSAKIEYLEKLVRGEKE